MTRRAIETYCTDSLEFYRHCEATVDRGQITDKSQHGYTYVIGMVAASSTIIIGYAVYIITRMLLSVSSHMVLYASYTLNSGKKT